MNTNQPIALLAVQDQVAGLYAWGLPLEQIVNNVALSMRAWNREWTTKDIEHILEMAGVSTDEISC
jgi:hypothetical protein